MNLRLPLAASLVALVAACSAPAAMAATPKTETATSGNVTATLTYVTKDYFPIAKTLTITQSGTVVYSEPVKSKFCFDTCSAFSSKQSLHILSLDPATGPQVVLDLWTGGAHCCQVEQVFSPSGTTYSMAQYNFADPGEGIVNRGGQELFATADDRFAYAFTDYAASGMPVEFIQFTAGKFVNVTRNYPSVIAKDAAFWLKTFKSQAKDKYTDTVGLIAAWAADEDELGNSAKVATYLAAQAKAGHLNSALTPGHEGTKFINSLNRFLRRTGYLK